MTYKHTTYPKYATKWLRKRKDNVHIYYIYLNLYARLIVTLWDTIYIKHSPNKPYFMMILYVILWNKIVTISLTIQ